MSGRRGPLLAEGRWLWRRLYAFLVSAGLWVSLDRAVRHAPPEQAQKLAEGLMHLMALTILLYLVAPSAQQLVELAAALRLRLAGR